LGDRFPLAASTGHQDRLAPFAQAPVGSRLQGVFQFRFFRGC
jgi:hypothetical protein